MAIRGIPPSSRWFLYARDRHTVTERGNPIYTKPILLKFGFQAVTTTFRTFGPPAPWHDGPRGSRIPIGYCDADSLGRDLRRVGLHRKAALQVVHITPLGCEFDELVGRGGDAAVG